MKIRGQDLRSARAGARVSLSRVAAYAEVSVGHLSRIERGEREVTPNIMLAYEQALGREVAATPNGTDALMVEDMRRRALLSGIAAASLGAAAVEPLTHLLSGLPAPDLPQRIGQAEVLAVEDTLDYLTRLDLTRGGGLAAHVARGSLDWAVGLLRQTIAPSVQGRLYSATAALTDRIAWSHYDVGEHDTAIRLLTTALNMAAQGDSPDLKAHILLNLSTVTFDQHRAEEAVQILTLGLGDAKVSPVEQANLHAVCARHCGGQGERQVALRHLGMAEDALAEADTSDAAPWARQVTASPGHFDSALGLALFAMGETDAAQKKFTNALAVLSDGRVRTKLRCRTRLGLLQLQAGDLAAAQKQAEQILTEGAGVRSSRVRQDVRAFGNAIRTAGMTDLAHEMIMVTS